MQKECNSVIEQGHVSFLANQNQHCYVKILLALHAFLLSMSYHDAHCFIRHPRAELTCYSSYIRLALQKKSVPPVQSDIARNCSTNDKMHRDKFPIYHLATQTSRKILVVALPKVSRTGVSTKDFRHGNSNQRSAFARLNDGLSVTTLPKTRVNVCKPHKSSHRASYRSQSKASSPPDRARAGTVPPASNRRLIFRSES
jgi:hypothetical protein